MRWTRENSFDGDIQAAASRRGVPMPLIKATIAVESGFNPSAKNLRDPGGAWGLMQMIPATARALGYSGPMESLLTNTALAIDLGAQLLAQNLARTASVTDSVSAYNGGFRPASGFGGVRADGTYTNQAYVDKVMDALRYFGGSAWLGLPEGGGTAPAGATFPPGGSPRVHRVGSLARFQAALAWLRRVLRI